MDNLEKEWAKVFEERKDQDSSTGDSRDMTADWAAALEEQRSVETAQRRSFHGENVRSSLNEKGAFSAHSDSSAQGLGIEMLLHIPVEVSVVLGETKMLVNDLVQLGQGSIIELNKLAGDKMDLLVNDRLLGRGEVVVINEHFGVKLAEIISPQDRIKNLG
jgi:flagellar motor switch protein FliN/FliY